MTILQTAHSSIYLGTGRNRIYLEQETYITFAGILGFTEKPNITVYYTELNKIPLDFYQKMQMGKYNVLKKIPF